MVRDPSECIYGLLAEFDEPDRLLGASREAVAAGYRVLDAYSPFPIAGLEQALGLRPTRLPVATLIGGIVGGITAYAILYYASVISYPLNVGGRPLHSWPAFIPITFELTILGASVAAFFGMLARNGLPQPYHPLFDVPEFSFASRNRFFLCIESRDPLFDRLTTRRFLEKRGAIVHEVPL